jgi:hypothetical protein
MNINGAFKRDVGEDLSWGRASSSSFMKDASKSVAELVLKRNYATSVFWIVTFVPHLRIKSLEYRIVEEREIGG